MYLTELFSPSSVSEGGGEISVSCEESKRMPQGFYQTAREKAIKPLGFTVCLGFFVMSLSMRREQECRQQRSLSNHS